MGRVWSSRVFESFFCVRANHLGICGCRIVRFSEGVRVLASDSSALINLRKTRTLCQMRKGCGTRQILSVDCLGCGVGRKDAAHARQCVGRDAACLVDATRVSFPLTNTFMEFSFSPASSVYSKESFETNFMMYRV